MTNDPSKIRAALGRALAALPAPESLLAEEPRRATRRLKERLTRDLLPRLSGEHPPLLVGIAGPNNAGKSSLFNAILGIPLSPARPEGGFTRQCLAAAHPGLWTGDLKSLVEQRYDVVLVDQGSVNRVAEPGPPGRLLLCLREELAPGLLVMDTPDFDSIYAGNRANTEALLVTVDLLVFVVSRQTYQNAALVEFLKTAVGHGRPYVLVYNEATRRETALAHIRKLSADVGLAPLASYVALHQPEVESGAALLSTEPVDRAPPLASLLGDPTHAARLKASALAAALKDAREELSIIAAAVEEQAAQPERLSARLWHELGQVGESAARKAVPADILIEAFQDELDARSAFNRIVRRQLRRVMGLLARVGRRVRASFVGPETVERTVAALTEAALKDGVRHLLESMAPEVAAWRGDERTSLLLRRALGQDTLDRLEQPLELPELRRQEDRADLYRFCRELVGVELTGGGREQLIQAATTLVYTVPAGVAGFLSVATGGIGHDAVVWIAAAVSTPVLEKLVDLLGEDIREAVSRKWSEAHGASLARGLGSEICGELLSHLDEQVQAASRMGAELSAAREELT